MRVKTIHFNCPTCEQPVETPADMSGKLMNCPTCSENLRPPRPAPKASPSWLVLLCLGVVGAGLCFGIPLERWLATDLPKRETSYELRRRLETEAQDMLSRQCTNVIVGLNRIINRDLFLANNDPNQWTARVTAEYVNHFGGIDRTNMPFVFWVYDSPVDNLRHVLCRVDEATLSRRDAPNRPPAAHPAIKK